MSVAIAVQIITTLGAVAAAIIAGIYAKKSQEAEVAAARVLELEKRIAGMKEDIYRPMVELLRSLWDSVKTGKQPQQTEMIETLSKFTAWTQIYGSDDVVITFHKMMQASFHDAPPNVTMRCIAEMLLALRRDLGDPETKIDVVDLLGMRITDIYESEMLKSYSLQEEQFFEAEGWSAPWGGRFKNRN